MNNLNTFLRKKKVDLGFKQGIIPEINQKSYESQSLLNGKIVKLIQFLHHTMLHLNFTLPNVMRCRPSNEATKLKRILLDPTTMFLETFRLSGRSTPRR